MSTKLRLLYQDSDFVAVDKPAGFQVHPPEDPRHQVSKQRNCLHLLRNQLGTYVFPVHRLDRATSGVLLFALNAETARLLNQAFREHEVEKTYFAVVRGWVALEGHVDYALRSEQDPQVRKPSQTDFARVATVEFAEPVGRYTTARYSLVRISPLTGRMHQIRRHFAHVSHPLVGDSVYGDGAHNRFIEKRLGSKALLLKAYSLGFRHPRTGVQLKIRSRWDQPWHSVFDDFQICPHERP